MTLQQSLQAGQALSLRQRRARRTAHLTPTHNPNAHQVKSLCAVHSSPDPHMQPQCSSSKSLCAVYSSPNPHTQPQRSSSKSHRPM